MPTVKTRTDDGEAIHVHLPTPFLWLVGVMTTLTTTAIVAAVSILISLNTRVTVIENTRVTPAILSSTTDRLVPQGEYNIFVSVVNGQLTRIQNTQDQILKELRDGGD